MDLNVCFLNESMLYAGVNVFTVDTFLTTRAMTLSLSYRDQRSV